MNTQNTVPARYSAFSPFGNKFAASNNLEELIEITNDYALKLGGDCFIVEGESDEDEIVYETYLTFCEA